MWDSVTASKDEFMLSLQTVTKPCGDNSTLGRTSDQIIEKINPSISQYLMNK